ncbi:MAG: hypothetical protein IT389_13480 [Nitrospira sp.]|nr:hypothetical protein [Nitrospira sp.]
MVKTYSVRNADRRSTHCAFLYFWNGTLQQGKVWDLSETGWRASVKHPLPAGSEMTVYLALPDRNAYKYMIVNMAAVCWSDGHTTGWKVSHIDEAAKSRLDQFLNGSEED